MARMVVECGFLPHAARKMREKNPTHCAEKWAFPRVGQLILHRVLRRQS